MGERDRKRKNADDSKALEDDDPLALCLSPPSRRPNPLTPHPPLSPPSPGPPQHSFPPPPPPPPPLLLPDFISVPSSAASAPSAAAAAAAAAIPPARHPRARRNPSKTPRGAHKSDTVPPPFSWATDRRATVHSLNHLLSQNITNITGEAQCKRCEASQVISYDLVSKFNEVAAFIRARKHWMHDRAPAEWMTPAFPDCRSCGQPNCMRPVVAAKKRSINWLFMLLGQTLGCCTLDQLKYFCKHTKNHRTGAKDRVLYLTYLALCKQLHPAGPF
ncbi:wiskott-Aldrich syndrome protein family member 2-like [Phoenix dactylifera]|uniref:Wiskott-Aldrich syndrome protein family member 2-like n=1 Tax=Phoenix dactylifera TaxID=42345 RepID=A0A8B8ZAD9_PHODC|nr:wiskott-Aldrich syndrome protein family member 2-like [Phoenix dactylifera]